MSLTNRRLRRRYNIGPKLFPKQKLSPTVPHRGLISNTFDFSWLDNPADDLRERAIQKIKDDEVLRILFGEDAKAGIAKANQEIKAQVLFEYPNKDLGIDYKDLAIKFRVGLLCAKPKRFLKDFDFKASDFKTKQIRLILLYTNEPKAVIREMVKNLEEEKLRPLQGRDWTMILRHVPHATKKLNIRWIRNQTDLRTLVLARPSILKHATLDDLKASPLKAPEWARIAVQLSKKKRGYFPVGFQHWAEKEIFKLGLGGRRFKPFPPEWRDGTP